MNQIFLTTIIFCIALLNACSDNVGPSPYIPPDPPQPVITANGFDTPNSLDYHSRFSPDGSQIAYTIYDGTVTEVWLYNISEQLTRPLIQSRSGDLYLSWSPDGTQLVYDSRTSSGLNQLFIYNISNGNSSLITNPSNSMFLADWCRATNKIVLVYNGFLSEMNPDGTEITRILNDSRNILFTAVSFDGTYIAYDSDRNGNRDLYVINRDGTNETRITDFSGEDTRPRWSPDGTKLLYESDRSGNRDLWVHDFNTQTHTQITFTPGWDSMGDWSPDGTQIVFSEEHDTSSRYGSRISIINYQQ